MVDTRDGLCGARCFHPRFLQRFANSKAFIFVYGLLGTVQAMSYMYFIVTLTTLEKRFKIPSHTTGIVLSGNEISQILLSPLLSYYGGQRNRPLLIAMGGIICGFSCFVLAMPHFIFGAGEDALRLTKEFVANEEHIAQLKNITLPSKGYHRLCLSEKIEDECDESFSVVPLVLIFISQFILGIGNTLYYSLGQSYMDDNTKKTNTPLMLGYAFSLRMFGPLVGFVLSYGFLNMYIDPTKTPIINSSDPRWMGAWWAGWIVLGFTMIFFSCLIGLFPRNLPKKPQKTLQIDDSEKKNDESSGRLLELQEVQLKQVKNIEIEKPKLKNFPTALKRLLTNKLLIFNILSGVFYILGSGGYMTFLSKYIEVQFHKTRADSTIVAGPLNLLGMVIGLLSSGYYIAKKKPHPSKLLLWNVFIGVVYILGQFTFLFLTCTEKDNPFITNGKVNATQECNQGCNCDSVPYTPVCHQTSQTTFFSACHAGCASWDYENQIFSNCSCVGDNFFLQTQPLFENLESSTISAIKQITDSTDDFVSYSDKVIENRQRRDVNVNTLVNELLLIPGACVAGCSTAFLMFTLVSSVINLLGATGKIGNILVNYRSVSVEDKSFSQGLMLMLISLLALIPGPIIYGWIIDNTCLVWNYKCGKLGNCQVYDPDKFRIHLNGAGLCLTTIGVVFDFLVWKYGKNMDLYSEDYEDNNRKINKSHRIAQSN